MPRIKKSPLTAQIEIQPIVSPEEKVNISTPVATSDRKEISKKEKSVKAPIKDSKPEIQDPSTKMPKEEFKQLYIKDTYWLENDIYQTIVDMTEGKKNAKALLINQALKDYFKKNKLAIKPLRAKEKKA